MSAPPSLTLAELDTILALLERQENLSTTLQSAVSKLQAQDQDQAPALTPALTPGPPAFIPNQPSLTIRIPVRRPRSPSEDRDDARQSRAHPRRRTTAGGTFVCKRGAVRPPGRVEKSAKKGWVHNSNEEDADEERDISQAQDESESNKKDNNKKSVISLVRTGSPHQSVSLRITRIDVDSLRLVEKK